MKREEQKGITLVALIITVIVLGIIAGTAAYTITSTPNADKLNNMYADIYNLNDKIVLYYSNNRKLPILKYTVTLPIDAEKNVNDNENYYVIDLSQLENLTLNYGKDYSSYTSGKDDVYVINEQSHTVYYLKGITFEEKNYYTIPESYEEIENTDYFSKFITEWTVEDNDTIILPVKGVCNFKVNWGDGTQSTINSTTAETDNNREHTYEAAGTYTVKIWGNVEQWNFYTFNTSKDKITRIVQWGEIGVNIINFSNCTNLAGTIPEPTEKSFENVIRFDRLFDNCSKLIGEIPKNLFNSSKKVRSFYCTFAQCSGLTGSIPENLFTNTGIDSDSNSISFRSTFYNCSGLNGNIPSTLFSNNGKDVSSFQSTFYNCSGLTGEIPEDLFNNCGTNIESFALCFAQCSGLTGSIPENLFANCGTNVKTFYGTFTNCNGLTGKIPENLFVNSSKVEDFSELFSSCRNLEGEIPEKLFEKSASTVNSFYATFYVCNSLSGNVPKLWDVTIYPNVTNYAICFAGCGWKDGHTNITNFSDIPEGWYVQL